MSVFRRVGLALALIGFAAFVILWWRDRSPTADLSEWGEPTTVAEFAQLFTPENFPANANSCEDDFDDWHAQTVLVSFSDDLNYESETATALGNHIASMNSAFADCIAGRDVDMDDLRAQHAALIEAIE